tara:strand:- start:657 stop:1142 length:486 start_codon:yes stop_codon:yes gene_type:complete
MRISKKQLRQIIREEYTRLKIRRMLNENKGDLVKRGLDMDVAKKKANNQDGVLLLIEASVAAQCYLFPTLRGLKGVQQFNKLEADEDISCMTLKNASKVLSAATNMRLNPKDEYYQKEMFKVVKDSRLGSSTNKIKKSDIDDQNGVKILFLPAEFAKSLFK